MPRSASPDYRAEAEVTVAKAYRAAGLVPPRLILWLGSPLAGVIGTMYLQYLLGALRRPRITNPGPARLADEARGQVWDQDATRLGRLHGGDSWDPVWDLVAQPLGALEGDPATVRMVQAAVKEEACGYGWHGLRRDTRRQVRSQALGGTLARTGARLRSWSEPWRRFMSSESRIFAGVADAGQAAGWQWALRGAAVLTEPPCHVTLDDAGRLHNDEGPAVLYPDGFGVWAWHGLRVERHLIERPSTLVERLPPQTQTPLEALAWQAELPPEMYAEMEGEADHRRTKLM